jgi:hypothetical protein
MSDDLDGLLRAAVRAEAPDWLEQLVTERALASVQAEASSFGAAFRRLHQGVAGFARDMRGRVRARPALASELRGLVRAALTWPRGA